jgi:hypothetical protein
MTVGKTLMYKKKAEVQVLNPEDLILPQSEEVWRYDI